MPRNTIAMGVRVPVSEGGANQINPFQAGLDIMRMRQLANENTQFQLQLQANSAIGSIMAGYPDIESGLQAVAKSPWAAYSSQYINTMRSAELASAQIAQTHATTGKLNLEAGDTAQHIFVKNMIPYWDGVRRNLPEDQLNTIRDAAIQQTLATQGGMTSGQRTNAVAGMQAWFSGINAGLPADPAAANAERSRRIGLSLASSGMSGPEIDSTLGKTNIVHMPQGDYIINATPFGIQPQGFIPAGIAPELAPTDRGVYPGTGYQPVQAAPYIPTGVPQPSGGAGSPNQLGGQPVPPPQAAPAAAPTAAPAAAEQVPLAADGTPLWTPDVMAQNPPQGRMDPTGTQWQWQGGPTFGAAVQDRAKTFNDKESPRFMDSSNAIRQFESMDASLDRLKDTLLRPGALASERGAAASAVNTGIALFNSTFGTKIPEFFGESLRDYNSFVKDMRQAQFSVLATQFGHQREAGTVVATAGQAVPGIENSFLGNKLVLEELKSGVKRYQDMYGFTQHWMMTHRGDPQGADIAFNKLHPAQDYENKVLSDFGLTRNGFRNQSAIDYAYAHNWIDDDLHEKATRQLQARQAREIQSP